VKTYYCETDFDTVVAGCPVPLVMAGGKKLPELDALAMAHQAIAAGADMGRNIFQSDYPLAMLRAIGGSRARRAAMRESAEEGKQSRFPVRCSRSRSRNCAPGSRGRSEIRVIFASDPGRSALLLLGRDTPIAAGDWCSVRDAPAPHVEM
jgi:hypothetical protein